MEFYPIFIEQSGGGAAGRTKENLKALELFFSKITRKWRSLSLAEPARESDDDGESATKSVLPVAAVDAN